MLREAQNMHRSSSLISNNADVGTTSQVQFTGAIVAVDVYAVD